MGLAVLHTLNCSTFCLVDFSLMYFQYICVGEQFVADITFLTNAVRIHHVLDVAVVLLQLSRANMALELWIWSFVRVAVIHVPLQVRCSFEFLSTLLTLMEFCFLAKLLWMVISEHVNE